MHIVVNGEPTEVPETLTILGLLGHLKLSGPVAVERNRQVVPRAEHASTILCEGDILEVVHFVGGG